MPTLRAYLIGGSAISHFNSYVDLGVTVSSSLSFVQHINNIVSKARQRISILLRGFLSRDLSTMRLAFITYIRPLLEYNSIVWNPNYIYLIDLIENVQRKFTKALPSIYSLSYSERLASLNLDLLELRRVRFDLVYYYKVLNHLTPFTPSEVFNIYSPPACSRSELPYLLKPTHATNRLMSSLFYRSIDAWNALPVALRSSSSLSTFKHNLMHIDLTKFLRGSAIDQSN